MARDPEDLLASLQVGGSAVRQQVVQLTGCWRAGLHEAKGTSLAKKDGQR